jgi:hypothetical protein
MLSSYAGPEKFYTIKRHCIPEENTVHSNCPENVKITNGYGETGS